MAQARLPLHALRPVLLAGAAALTWLTFSSSAATADSPHDPSSLSSALTSSVASPVGNVGAALPTGMNDGGTPPQSGLLQPAVAPASGAADTFIASVPAVSQVTSQVAPPGVVSAITTPVAAVAGDVAAGVVEAAATPAGDVVPVVIPVLEPVAGLVAGAAPLPEMVPVLAQPAAVLTTAGLPETTLDSPVAAGPSLVSDVLVTGGTGVAAESLVSPSATAVAGPDEAGIPLAAASPPGRWQADGMASPRPEPSLPAGPSDPPLEAPDVPGSAASGTSSSSAFGAAAWLSPFAFHPPAAGVVLAGEAIQHSPAAVSFDPGSSPD